MKRPRFKYSVPIESPQHADWCLREAAQHYGGQPVVDDYGMSLIEDPAGLRHTDDVLRALSHFRHRLSRNCWCKEER